MARSVYYTWKVRWGTMRMPTSPQSGVFPNDFILNIKVGWGCETVKTGEWIPFLKDGSYLWVGVSTDLSFFVAASGDDLSLPVTFSGWEADSGRHQGTATVLLRVLLLLLLFPDDVTYTIRVLREWSIRFCRWTLGERKNVYRLWTWVERAQTLFLPLTSLLPLLTREITVEHNKRCVLDKFQKSVPSPFVVFVHETLH